MHSRQASRSLVCESGSIGTPESSPIFFMSERIVCEARKKSGTRDQDGDRGTQREGEGARRT